MNDAVILLPTYNERENVALLIPEIFAAHPDIRVLVIDDSSPDGTAEKVRELAAAFPNLALLLRAGKEGLGAAYKHGMREAVQDRSVRRVLTMDADGSHAVRHIRELLAAGADADVVVGSRYIKGGGIAQWEPWRYALSKYGNLYARALTGLRVHDLTGGMNLYDADLLRRLDFASVGASGYAFQMEMKFAAKEAGARLVEVPILFEARREGESKISARIIREGLRAPWGLFGRRTGLWK